MLLEDLKLILKVAEFRSITAAAESLNMRTATASAAIKRVENSLGIELFTRTTRQLRLSGAGEKYIPQCMQALEILEQATQGIKNELGTVDGEVRIATSSDLGRNKMASWLDAFAYKHPKVRIKLHISDSQIDFYRDSVDMALRYGSPNDNYLYGFKICDIPRILCATPEYLGRYGIPKHPHDLASHNGLFYQLSDIVKNVWKFSDGQTEYRVKMKGNRTANDGDIVRRWCVAGRGVCVKSALDMSADLLAGRVINVMPAFAPEATELWLICPSRHFITPAVRLLKDSLKKECHDLLQKMRERNIIL